MTVTIANGSGSYGASNETRCFEDEVPNRGFLREHGL